MRFEDAKKLHNGDRVTIKSSLEHVTVINSWIQDKQVLIEVDTLENGFKTLTHLDIS
jgi:hypothetical protein